MKYSYAQLSKSLVSVFWGAQWIVLARIRHAIEASYDVAFEHFSEVEVEVGCWTPTPQSVTYVYLFVVLVF